MRKLLKIMNLLLVLGYAAMAWSQSVGVPQKFSYTTQVTDSLGHPVANTLVTMRTTLTTGSPSGPAVYTEVNSGVTSPAGIFTIVVGGGTILNGHIGSVPWISAPVYLSSEMDVTGGTNFVPTGSAQLISQPYAIVSGNGVGGVAFDPSGRLSVSTVDSAATLTSSQGSWLTGGNTGAGGHAYLGTNDSSDLVFRQNGAEAVRITHGNTTIARNLGINTSTPLTAAQVNGALALQDTSLTVSGDFTLDVSNRSSFRVYSSVSASSAVCSLTDGRVPGQLLMIMVSQVNNANNGITFNAGSNLRLSSSGNHNLNDAGVITFIWNGSQWLQSSVSRNN